MIHTSKRISLFHLLVACQKHRLKPCMALSTDHPSFYSWSTIQYKREKVTVNERAVLACAVLTRALVYIFLLINVVVLKHFPEYLFFIDIGKIQRYLLHLALSAGYPCLLSSARTASGRILLQQTGECVRVQLHKRAVQPRDPERWWTEERDIKVGTEGVLIVSICMNRWDRSICMGVSHVPGVQS